MTRVTDRPAPPSSSRATRAASPQPSADQPAAPPLAVGAPGWTPKTGQAGQPRPPLFDDTTDIRYDGFVLAGQGAVIDPQRASLKSLAGVLPDNGAPVRKRVVFINGIMTDVKLQKQNLQSLANVGFEVVGVHNATKGLVDDLAQCVGDKLGLTRQSNRAIQTTAKFIEQALENPKGIEFIGHSQGAIILSEALAVVEERLKAKGLSAEKIAQRFAALELETIGGASRTFPPGVRVRHVVNTDDLVPLTAGRGVFDDARNFVVRFGEFGSLHDVPAETFATYFARAVDQAVHGVELYARHLREAESPSDGQGAPPSSRR